MSTFTEVDRCSVANGFSMEEEILQKALTILPYRTASLRLQSVLGQIACLSAFRDPFTGRYVFASADSRPPVSSVEQLHIRLFRRWLQLSVSSQKEDVRRLFTSTSELIGPMLATWRYLEPHRSFVPLGVGLTERGEFIHRVSLITKELADECSDDGCETLTGKEFEVVALILEAKSDKEIAVHQQTSVRTVRFHISNLFRKFEAKSRTELVGRLLADLYLNRTQDFWTKGTREICF